MFHYIEVMALTKFYLKGSVQANLGIWVFCLETVKEVLVKALPKQQRKSFIHG